MARMLPDRQEGPPVTGLDTHRRRVGRLANMSPPDADRQFAAPFATAAGLVERSAAAYAAGVPERPADDGFFGPASVTWRISADLAGPVAGLRALLMQALHPLAMAGVDQHSDWREDPVGQSLCWSTPAIASGCSACIS